MTDAEIRGVDFTDTKFWVNVFGIRLMKRNKVNWKRIGDCLVGWTR